MGAKKYRISEFYIGIFIVALIFINAATAFTISLDPPLGVTLLMFAIDTICTLCCIHKLFFDFAACKFSLDENGITMYIGFKANLMKWEDCKSFGIVDVRVEQTASTFWVYCARRPLSGMEKQKFLSKTRRDLSLVHYFQYSKEPFEEMLKYIPEKEAQYLRDQVARIQMNPIEKLYHRR